jgi:anti-sigma regulatory factor (Ser/Thr protein kinase)
MTSTPGDEPDPVQVELPSDRSAPAVARARTRGVLRAWRMPALLDPLLLVVSELVGNAVRHGRAPVRYEVHVDDDDLVLTVTDGNPAPPGPGSCCDSTAEGGRGLFLVGQLTRCWGWKPSGEGKQVWARV